MLAPLQKPLTHRAQITVIRPAYQNTKNGCVDDEYSYMC